MLRQLAVFLESCRTYDGSSWYSYRWHAILNCNARWMQSDAEIGGIICMSHKILTLLDVVELPTSSRIAIVPRCFCSPAAVISSPKHKAMSPINRPSLSSPAPHKPRTIIIIFVTNSSPHSTNLTHIDSRIRSLSPNTPTPVPSPTPHFHPITAYNAPSKPPPSRLSLPSPPFHSSTFHRDNRTRPHNPIPVLLIHHIPTLIPQHNILRHETSV